LAMMCHQTNRILDIVVTAVHAYAARNLDGLHC